VGHYLSSGFCKSLLLKDRQTTQGESKMISKLFCKLGLHKLDKGKFQVVVGDLADAKDWQKRVFYTAVQCQRCKKFQKVRFSFKYRKLNKFIDICDKNVRFA
jgi:hypothetical protein